MSTEVGRAHVRDLALSDARSRWLAILGSGQQVDDQNARGPGGVEPHARWEGTVAEAGVAARDRVADALADVDSA